MTRTSLFLALCLASSSLAMARPIGDMAGTISLEGGPIGSFCSHVASVCADLWVVVYDDCMERKGMDLETFDSADLDEMYECFDEADWAYDDCLYGAGC